MLNNQKDKLYQPQKLQDLFFNNIDLKKIPDNSIKTISDKIITYLWEKAYFQNYDYNNKAEIVADTTFIFNEINSFDAKGWLLLAKLNIKNPINIKFTCEKITLSLIIINKIANNQQSTLYSWKDEASFLIADKFQVKKFLIDEITKDKNLNIF